jgi:hypothetical protein
VAVLPAKVKNKYGVVFCLHYSDSELLEFRV